MTIIKIRDYTAPKTLEQALELLNTGDYKVGAGCTDLMPQVRDGKYRDISLLDLRLLKKELSGICLKDGALHIGAMTRHDDIACDPLVLEYIPPLATACGQIGSAQVRKRGTIGGNILNASPAADSVPALVAADASVVLVSYNGTRQCKLTALLRGPGRTDIAKNEIMTEIVIPVANGPWTGSFFKVGPRNALTISVADAVVLHNDTDGYRIACGSVAATVVRALETEKLFNQGQPISKQAMEKALSQDIHPIDDVRASGHYRSSVLRNLLHNFYTYER